MLSLQKKKILFSLFTPQLISIDKHPACETNRDEQGGAGKKFEVLNDPKVFLLELRSIF